MCCVSCNRACFITKKGKPQSITTDLSLNTDPVLLCLYTRSVLLEWDCSPGDSYSVTSGSSAMPLLGLAWPVGLRKHVGQPQTLSPLWLLVSCSHTFLLNSVPMVTEVGGEWYRKSYPSQEKWHGILHVKLNSKLWSTVSEVICIWRDWILDNTGEELK